MKKIIFLLLTFIIIPNCIYAATALTSSTQTPVVGTEIYVQLNIDYGKDILISEAHYAVSYNTDYFLLEDVIWSQSKGTYSIQDGIIKIDKANDGNYWEYGGQVQLKLLVLKAGVNKISIKENGVARFKNGDIISQTFSGVTISAVEASSQTTIGSLAIENYAISPTFNRSTYRYTLKVPANVTEVNVIAKKGNEKQKITGDGKRVLTYGDNRIRVIVSAEDGSASTYEIMVTREDDRTGDVSLKNMLVSGSAAEYIEEEDTYQITVSKTTQSVLITAQTTDSNATLTGTGEKKLEYGLNIFYLNVKSNGGKEKTYKVKVTREEKEEVLNDSTLFKSFTINEKKVPLSDEKRTILFGVDNDISKLDINYELMSNSSTVLISGNENLKYGINEIKVDVTNYKNEKTEYRILVYKKENNYIKISSLDDVMFYRNRNMLYESLMKDEHKIEENIFNELNNNNNKLMLNVIDEYGGLYYQVLVNDDNESDFDYDFNIVDQNRFIYETKLPKNCDVLLYVGDKYVDDISVKIYTANDDNYTLYTEGVKVVNGYISFKTNGNTKYMLTMASLGKKKSSISKYIGLGFFIILIGGLSLYVYVKKKKIKGKEENKKIEEEKPLY